MLQVRVQHMPAAHPAVQLWLLKSVCLPSHAARRLACDAAVNPLLIPVAHHCREAATEFPCRLQSELPHHAPVLQQRAARVSCVPALLLCCALVDTHSAEASLSMRNCKNGFGLSCSAVSVPVCLMMLACQAGGMHQGFAPWWWLNMLLLFATPDLLPLACWAPSALLCVFSFKVAAFADGRESVNEYDCLLLEHVFGNRPDDSHKVRSPAASGALVFATRESGKQTQCSRCLWPLPGFSLW